MIAERPVETISQYLKTSEVVSKAKEACGITKPNSEMTDEEIRTVIRWVVQSLPDTSWSNGKAVFGRIGIGLMLFLTLVEFPEFYMRYGLSQFN